MIRMEVNDLTDLLNLAQKVAFLQGRHDLETRVTESTRALLAENNQLKAELDSAESRLRVKDQKDCFPAVREEQLRIVRSILHYTKLGSYERGDLLAALMLADLAKEIK